MPDWKEDYLAALEARDATEQAGIEIYKAYTRIAARVGELSQKQPAISDPPEQPISHPAPVAGKRSARLSTPPPSESVVLFRQDLAKAQHERGDLQARLDVALKELETLRAKTKIDTKRIAQLQAGVTQMTVRLRDRDEELKGKAKLVEDVQDEMVMLNLQLNLAEEQSKKLKMENQELVDRWMARMGKEADAMNRESKFG